MCKVEKELSITMETFCDPDREGKPSERTVYSLVSDGTFKYFLSREETIEIVRIIRGVTEKKKPVKEGAQ